MSTPLSLHIQFWGVRGSHPVPGSRTVGFGGNTACVEINADRQTIICDAGTGIIELGRSLVTRARQSGTAVEAALFFTHFHHDHIQGFPFFSPAYSPSTRLYLFGPESFEQNLEAVLARNQTPPMFPVTLQEMSAAKYIHTIQEGDRIVLNENADGAILPKIAGASCALPTGSVLVRVYRSYAHPGGVLVYRIEYGGLSVVYATDTEGYVGTDRRLATFARGADLLIHDAQYTDEHYRGQRAGLPPTQGFGHSTSLMACEVAAAAEVKQLVLFHHDPGYDDETLRSIETQAQQQFPRTVAAYEGLEITLGNTQPSFATALSQENGVVTA